MLNTVQLVNDTGTRVGPIRLLIIDDDPIDRQRYRRHLAADTENTYVVVEAETAEAGISLLLDGPYDCIVLDYRLPGRDGLAVFEALRRGDTNNSLPPVIMMTGQGSERIAVEAMKCGVADYLTKDNISPKTLQRAIINAVDKWRLRVSLGEKNKRLAEVNSDLKARAAELQRVYHAVSHELKTPLTAVREFVALVLDGIDAPSPSPNNRTFLEYALDGCDQMAHQVNDLVDSTRLEMHKMRLRLEPVRVDRTVEFALASIRQIARAKCLTLKDSIASNLPPVTADAGRFAQILGNLLGNAAKFTDAGGTIKVTARLLPGAIDYVEIAVSDTGCGIDPEHQGQIFDRLFQVPHAGDELMGGGLGLGLSIARELVVLHTGKLTVESELGCGSTFKFTLPVMSQRECLLAPAAA